MKADDFDLSYSEWEHFINEWCRNKKEREMVKRHILDGDSVALISEEFNYSYQQTYKKVHDAESEIFRHIKNK